MTGHATKTAKQSVNGKEGDMNDRWADLIIAGLIGFGALLMVASYLLIVAAAWRVVFGG